eukprot:167128-Chlamydomonas_euryale.AAC.13
MCPSTSACADPTYRPTSTPPRKNRNVGTSMMRRSRTMAAKSPRAGSPTRRANDAWSAKLRASASIAGKMRTHGVAVAVPTSTTCVSQGEWEGWTRRLSSWLPQCRRAQSACQRGGTERWDIGGGL